MLNITRKPGEAFTIGKDITVIVTSVRGKCVRVDWFASTRSCSAKPVYVGAEANG